MTPRNIALTMVAVCLAVAPALARAGRSLSQDEIFLAARDAFRAGDAARLARYAPMLDRYPLQSWVEYWRLETRLEQAQSEEIRGFLERNDQTYLAEALRRDWMRVLGKKQDWDLFLKEEPRVTRVDAEIACYGLLARSSQNGELDPDGLREYWAAPRALPEGCVPLVEAALQSGQFGPQQVWERFRLLTAANLISAAKRTLTWLPPREAPDSHLLRAATSSPGRFLDRLPDLRVRPARELAIFAVSRLAHSDPQLAARKWENLQKRFAPDDQGYVWGRIATEGAKRHIPEAVDWFGEAAATPLGDEQLAWWARVALRQQKWSDVRGAIERMSPRSRDEPVWVYWRGRALRQLGQLEQSVATFERVVGDMGFYGQLAADELGRHIHLPPRAVEPTREELERAAATPGLQRALALYRLDMRVEGMREWNWAIRGMDDRKLLAAAELARRNGVWDRSINTADRTVSLHDFALRYPAPYAEVLIAQARSHELEEHWVLGLVRQESRFVASAKSSAGASGLMQLMPATARWVAKKIALRDYSWSRITEVDVNAALGTAYLKHVLDGLDGSLLLAAAGYNAGPARARRWRDERPIEGAIYAESIPFNETRDYVKRVMANTVLYSTLMGGPAQTLKERLGVIAPRASIGRVTAVAMH